MKHISIKIHGNVHGVGFRFFTEKKALELNICGFVCNEPGGTVYIEAEGEEKDLKELLDWCKKGPSFSKVDKIEHKYSDTLKGSDGFYIKY